jgi:hypothetical protein
LTTFSYKGNFEKGIRSGNGTVYVDGGTYELSSDFNNDEPAYFCNRMKYELVSPAPKVEDLDPKAKKDPKAAPVKKDFTEEEEQKYQNRICVEYKRGETDESGTVSGALLP